ncbi:hypothetical protein TWF569_006799 [Orbilia oligospora]|uniref:Uncharacterized protein n=1 Tax=Orbilia oligospora TaxID=2813651 RepID=A0A7C8JAN0_ORBOL|nr:hypothetical protein TWF706_011768 [Orbilia oligospora]KAF3089377.1 hypothetical protein TWF102_009647 [Orbilia oligospora]KAF3109680.1 hypothetical protein TWF103_005047 [Orbilia oligospora]KAF3144577.1 hypothetical protein TWF594_004732 [Orbilia oligospora]KAF3156215.1 hypothetical protein TWF569_006799 [Orbilia oligospora]
MQYSLLFLAAAGAFAPAFAAPVGDLGGITNAVGNIGSNVGGPGVNRVAGITQAIPKQNFHDDETEIPEEIEELEFIEDVIPEAGEDVSAQKKRQLGGLGGLGAVTDLLGGVTGGLGGGKVGRRGTEKEALGGVKNNLPAGGAADTVKGVKEKLPAGGAADPVKDAKDKLPKGPVAGIANGLAGIGGARETVASLTEKLPVRDVSV